MEPTAEAPLATILIVPPRPPGPPPPPGFGSFLVQGFGAARRAWLLALPFAVVEGLAGLAPLAPVLMAVAIVRHALARGEEPLWALSVAVRSPGVILPALGVAATGVLVAFCVRLALVSGAAGVFAADARACGKRAPRGTFADSFATFFAPLLRLGVAFALLAGSLTVAVWTTLVTAAEAYHRAVVQQTGGGLAALSLALALSLLFVLPPLLRLLGTLAAARVVAAGEDALIALHEAAALFLRRPFLFLALTLFTSMAGGLVASTLSAPGAAIPPGAGLPGLAARAALEGLGALAIAFASLMELAAFVAVVVARPASPVVPAILVAGPRNPEPGAAVGNVEPASSPLL